jgi:hypothetical protein
VTVLFDGERLRDAPRAGDRHPGHVVSRQIDEHRMLRLLLSIQQQLNGEAGVELVVDRSTLDRHADRS